MAPRPRSLLLSAGSRLVAVALLIAPASPASAQMQVSAPIEQPVAPATQPVPATDCAAVAAERAELQAQHAQIKRAIVDLAFGGPKRRPHVGAGDVGRAAAGTAASLLLPFGIGLALNAATGAAAKAGRKKGKKAAEPEPDVPALIDRQQAIEARLRELDAMPCAAAAPAAPAPAAPAIPSE